MSYIKEEISIHNDLLYKICYSLNTFTFKSEEEKKILVDLLEEKVRELMKRDRSIEKYKKFQERLSRISDYDPRL